MCVAAFSLPNLILNYESEIMQKYNRQDLLMIYDGCESTYKISRVNIFSYLNNKNSLDMTRSNPRVNQLLVFHNSFQYQCVKDCHCFALPLNTRS